MAAAHRVVTVTTPSHSFSYTDVQYSVPVHPRIEQFRQTILDKIQSNYITVVLAHIDKRLVAGKHSAERVLETSLARFIMSCLATSLADPVIPVDVTTDQLGVLRNDLMVKLAKDHRKLSPAAKTAVVDKIMTAAALPQQFATGYQALVKFVAATKLETPVVTVVRTPSDVTLDYSGGGRGDAINVPVKLYDKITDRFTPAGPVLSGANGGPGDTTGGPDLPVLIWCLIKRYMYLKSYNQQLGVHQATMGRLQSEFDVQFELFGSALNAVSPGFCSLFYDIERHFGSRGSLNLFTPLSGSYSMNPPFDERIIAESATRIVAAVRDAIATKQRLRVFVWIPVWDAAGIALCAPAKGFRKDASLYGNYAGLEVLEGSGVMVVKRRVCINEITYFDYFHFRSMYASDTYMIVVDSAPADGDVAKYEALPLRVTGGGARGGPAAEIIRLIDTIKSERTRARLMANLDMISRDCPPQLKPGVYRQVLDNLRASLPA